MVEKLTKDDFDCGLIKSKTYNEPFLSTEIETIQLPNPFLGMTIKSPKFSIITESTKKSQIDLDQSIGFSAKNVLYENVQFDFSEIERLVKEENLSDYKTNKEFLEHFSETEKIIIMKIKYSRKKGLLTKFNKSILKDMSFHLLDDKVREYTNIRKILEEIRTIRNQFFTDISLGNITLFENEDELIAKIKSYNKEIETDDVRASVKFYKDKKQKKTINESLKILKHYYKKLYNIFKDRIMEHFKVNQFPNFLIREIECKLKRKVNRQLIPKFKELYLKFNFYNSLEYLLIVDAIEQISSGKIQMFSDEYLSLEIRQLLFRIVILNLNNIFIETPSLRTKTILFNNTIEKYAMCMNLNNLINSELSTYISINQKNEAFEDTMRSLFNEIKAILGDKLRPYIFAVLSLTLMLSNYDIYNKRVISSEIESREKECLNRTLIYFSQYGTIENCDLWKFGMVLQSTLFGKYFTNNIETIYYNDMTVDNNNKIDLENEAFHNAKNKIPFDMINDKIRHCNDDRIVQGYYQLLETLPHKRKQSSCEKFGQFLRDFFVPTRERKPYINLSYSRLIPYDKNNNSSQTCIIIHGFIATNQNLYTQWENFIVDFDCYVDFYFYTWDSKTVSKIVKDILKFLGSLSLTILTRNFLKVFQVYRTYQHKNNVFAKTSKISSYAGKFLAYVIASKAFFEHKAITLVGFSLGAHVIKHTVKELNKIASYCPSVKNIIQNIVFIGGATSLPKEKKMWQNMKEFVAGRVINIYNPKDEVLTGIFMTIMKKNPIGTAPLQLEGVKVENYDFSDLKIKHVEYWDYSNIIIKKINLF